MNSWLTCILKSRKSIQFYTWQNVISKDFFSFDTLICIRNFLMQVHVKIDMWYSGKVQKFRKETYTHINIRTCVYKIHAPNEMHKMIHIVFSLSNYIKKTEFDRQVYSIRKCYFIKWHLDGARPNIFNFLQWIFWRLRINWWNDVFRLEILLRYLIPRNSTMIAIVFELLRSDWRSKLHIFLKKILKTSDILINFNSVEH